MLDFIFFAFWLIFTMMNLYCDVYIIISFLNAYNINLSIRQVATQTARDTPMQRNLKDCGVLQLYDDELPL